jgi:hypothetical protein
MLAVLAVSLSLIPGALGGHKESPMAAADPKANVVDLFAFRSYEPGSFHIVFIMTVDPMQDPTLGATASLFDPDVIYELKIDNNNDAIEDIVFRIRFSTEYRLPALFWGNAGAGTGALAPANSPPPVAPGTVIIPPIVNAFSSLGLGLRQSYTVTMIKGGITTPLVGPGPLYAVPPNTGPRTLDYNTLFNAGIQTLFNGVRTFAGTVDDPSFADWGGFMDTINFSKNPPVLTVAEDFADNNLAADSFSGFAVNAIALEVPISMLTRTAQIEPPTSTAATIGVWATTSRPRLLTRRAPLPNASSGTPSQVHRVGNPLFNDLLIGMTSKDKFGMDQPKNDSQFSSFLLDPSIARVFNAAFGGAIAIAPPPRQDLLPLFTYAPPVAAIGTPAGPVADMLRLNTGVNATSPLASNFNRLGLLGGDPAGFPNGRRLHDDVVDVLFRLVAGGVLAQPFPGFNPNIGGRLGDGVNLNDVALRLTFPFLANAPSGRSRRHVDPGEPLCTVQFGGGAPCLP